MPGADDAALRVRVDALEARIAAILARLAVVEESCQGCSAPPLAPPADPVPERR